ncbi:antitoxin VapB family protein [Candidatus Woesearchaeota archaeon]|nr:antitoxin VapB family protein [Candidatus Woesearchaeota archaeon]
MTTKTITITEDSYGLLFNNKFENESFSEEIVRVFSKKEAKTWKDLFGIISETEGEKMLEDLKKIRSKNIKMIRSRL